MQRSGSPVNDRSSEIQPTWLTFGGVSLVYDESNHLQHLKKFGIRMSKFKSWNQQNDFPPLRSRGRHKNMTKTIRIGKMNLSGCGSTCWASKNFINPHQIITPYLCVIAWQGIKSQKWSMHFLKDENFFAKLNHNKSNLQHHWCAFASMCACYFNTDCKRTR